MSIGHEIFNYEGMYDSDTEQSWRKAGAVDKVSNIQKIVEGLIDLEHLNICEIGCGDGAISQQLSDKKMFRRYQGYEISNSGVKAAKNRKIPNASFQIISPVAGDNKFKKADVVILCHVIEHLENPRELLSEAREISDILIVEVPLEANRGLGLDYDWDPVGHINKFNFKTIRQLLQTCDYQIMRQFTSNPSRQVRTFFDNSLKAKLVWIIKEYTLRLSPTIAKLLFTYHETILARKIEHRRLLD